MSARPLPPPPEQWSAHMDAKQVAEVTGCSERQVRNAERCGELSASRLTGSYGRKLWSREQVMAWRGISHEPGDPFVDAKVA
jgi:hypothetical protein